MKSSPLNSTEHVGSAGGSPTGAVTETELAASDIMDHGHIGSDRILPHHRAHELEYWHHHHAASSNYAVEGEMRVYDLRAPSQLVAMYLVYFVPLFVVGIAGWISQHWPATTPRGVPQLRSWLAVIVHCLELPRPPQRHRCTEARQMPGTQPQPEGL